MAAVPWHRLLGLLALATLVGAAGGGCGTDAVGVQTCRQIEEARCRRAPACAIPLEPPYHTSGGDVDECIRFYDDACLHGLTNGDSPSQTELNACLAAINGRGPSGDDCSVVSDPATASACSWLAPTPATAEASSSDDADSGE
jgi:hypothetical protein